MADKRDYYDVLGVGKSASKHIHLFQVPYALPPIVSCFFLYDKH